MEPARPLHDIFSELARDPAAQRGEGAEPGDALRAGGHGELPDALVAEAIVSYAGTAPAEVAEHLAPFVTGHGPVPYEDPAGLDVTHGLDLLATAPVAEPAPEDAASEDAASEDPFDLAFGEGTGAAEPVEAVAFDPATGTEGAVVGVETGSYPGAPDPEPEPDQADLFPGPPGSGEPAESGEPGEEPAGEDAG
jgi:hypothetical protein